MIDPTCEKCQKTTFFSSFNPCTSNERLICGCECHDTDTVRETVADTDKARDAAIAKLQDECDHPLSNFETYLIEAAFNTALAHAETQHAEDVKALKIALADAIRRPMGVIPDSAVGLLTVQELAEAETRRVNNG